MSPRLRVANCTRKRNALRAPRVLYKACPNVSFLFSQMFVLLFFFCKGQNRHFFYNGDSHTFFVSLMSISTDKHKRTTTKGTIENMAHWSRKKNYFFWKTAKTLAVHTILEKKEARGCTWGKNSMAPPFWSSLARTLLFFSPQLTTETRKTEDHAANKRERARERERRNIEKKTKVFLCLFCFFL